MSIFNILPGVMPWGIDGEVCRYFIYYLLGNITAEYNWIEKMMRSDLKYKLAGVFVLLNTNFLLSGCRPLDGSYLLAIIGVMGWVYMSILIEKYGRILESLGQASLCILCLHMPVGEVLTKIMVSITNMKFANCELELRYIFIRCALTILICMMCYYAIMKITPWMLGKKKNLNNLNR